MNVCTDVIEINMQDKLIVEYCNTTYGKYLLEKVRRLMRLPPRVNSALRIAEEYPKEQLLYIALR